MRCIYIYTHAVTNDALMAMDVIEARKHFPKLVKKLFTTKTFIIIFYCILQSIGQVGGPLLTRSYFLHGGKRKWLPSWLLTSAFPCLVIPIFISYAYAKNKSNSTRSLLQLTPKLIVSSGILGCILGINSYLFTFGGAYLPVSVSSLLGSTELAFTSVFAYIVVKHKFTHYSINAVVLMTFGSAILGLHMKGDRPTGETNGLYTLGFFMNLAAAALRGFFMAAVEYTHIKAAPGLPITYDLVMQMQFLVSASATLFCTIPMIINKDFQAIPIEAAKFELGAMKYYMILLSAALALQCLMIGSLGVIFSSTSLLGAIVSALIVPIQQGFAVFFLPESFNNDKGMALALCLWGFASFFYGEYKASRKKQVLEEVRVTSAHQQSMEFRVDSAHVHL